MTAFFALWRRLHLGTVRSVVAMVMSFAVPLVLFMFFGFVFGGMGGGGGMSNIPVVVAGPADQTGPLAEAFETIGGIRPDLTWTDRSGEEPVERPWTAERARQAAREGDADTVLILPEGWLQGILDFGGEPPEAVILSGDPTGVGAQILEGMLVPAAVQALVSLGPEIVGDIDPDLAGLQEAVAEGALTQEQADVFAAASIQGIEAFETLLEELEEQGDGDGESSGEAAALFTGFLPVTVEEVVVEGEELSIAAYYAGSVAVMFLLFMTTSLAGVLHQEEESGFLRRVLLGGAPVPTVLGAHLAHATVMSIANLTLMFTVAHLLFGAGLAGQVVELLVVGLAAGMAFGSFGLLMSSLLPDRKAVEHAAPAVILPMAAMGGSMVPSPMLPGWVRGVGSFLPNGWAVNAFEKVGLRRLDLASVSYEVALLVGFAVVGFAAAAFLWRRRWLA